MTDRTGAPAPAVWRIPALLAAATLAGLLIALTGGEQPWRAIAWALLSLPLLAGIAAYAGRWPGRNAGG